VTSLSIWKFCCTGDLFNYGGSVVQMASLWRFISTGDLLMEFLQYRCPLNGGNTVQVTSLCRLYFKQFLLPYIVFKIVLVDLNIYLQLFTASQTCNTSQSSR
jgi:hypothetical protein